MSPEQNAALIEFLTSHADVHGEVVYDTSDGSTHSAVLHDPERGFRRRESSPRENIVYSDEAVTPEEAMALVRDLIHAAKWKMPD